MWQSTGKGHSTPLSRAAKSLNTDTGKLDLEEVYDTGANAILWGKRSKAVKAMSKVVAKLMGRERPAAMKSHSDE